MPDMDPSKLISKLTAKSTKVRVEDVFAKLVEKMGGLDAFATEYVEQYKQAPTGGITKARYLTGIVQLGQLVSKRDVGSPIDDLSDEDMATELTETLTDLGQEIPIFAEGKDVSPSDQST